MTVFRAEHTSDQQREWKLEILDNESNTFIDDFKLNSDGVEIKTNGNKREIAQHIISTTAKFTVYVENADHEAFVLSLGTSVEGRYSVKIYLDNEIEFIGTITTDMVEIENGPKPYEFELEASDGLKLIKGKTWRQDSDLKIGFPFLVTLHDILFSALEALPCFDLYGVGDDFLSVAINWYSKEHEDNSLATGNVLESTRCVDITFAEKENEDFIDFDAFTTIEAIAKTFFCRVYQSKGRFIFEQIQLRQNDSVEYINYNSSKTILSTASINQKINVNQSDNYHLTGGTISIVPQVRQVDVIYDYENRSNYLPPPTPFTNSRTPGFESVGSYITSSGENKLRLQLTISSTVRDISIGGFTENHDIVFHFRLKIGDYYLSGDQVSTEWSLDSTSVFKIAYLQQPFLPPLTNPYQTTNGINIITADVIEDGTVEVDLFAVYRRYDGNGNYTDFTSPPSGILHSWNASDGLLEPVEDADINNQVGTTYTASIDDGSKKKEITIILGDGFIKNRPGVLSVRDVGAGIEYGTTTGWREGGTGTYEKLPQLLAITALSIQKKALRIYNGTVYAKTNHIRPENIVNYDGFDLIFNNTSLNSDKDEIDLEMIEISQDTTGIGTNVIDVVTDIAGGTGSGGNDQTGDPGFDPEDPTGGNDGLITDQVLIEGETVTTIEIVGADNDYFGTGDTVRIEDRITGGTQDFVLTAPILTGDTTMSVESATINFQIALFSPIFISPTFLAERRYPKYEYFANASGADVTVTAFDLPDPTDYTVAELRQRLHVYRQTGKLIYDIGFTLDTPNNKIVFAWNLSNEYVEVYFL